MGLKRINITVIMFPSPLLLPPAGRAVKGEQVIYPHQEVITS
jgi:hypothetical protein